MCLPAKAYRLRDSGCYGKQLMGADLFLLLLLQFWALRSPQLPLMRAAQLVWTAVMTAGRTLLSSPGFRIQLRADKLFATTMWSLDFLKNVFKRDMGRNSFSFFPKI